MNERYAIRIHRRDRDDGAAKFIATTVLVKLAESPDVLDARLRDIASEYARAITTVQETLASAKRGSNARGLAYWRAGQAILDFEKFLNAAGFYLAAQNATFARDLGMKEGTFRRFIAFRRRNPDANALDASNPWVPLRAGRVK